MPDADETRNAPTGMTDSYDWSGRDVVDSAGEKIGKVDEVYLASDDGSPEWLAVNTGLFGSKTSFVPIAGARPSGEDVQVAYTRDQVKDAPGVEPDEELNRSEERELWTHYGLDYGGDDEQVEGGVDVARDTPVDTGHDTSGPDTDDAMTRSEEELSVGTRKKETGRARLRKYVVTEQVTVTVPVRKEMAVLETEPIDDPDSAGAAGAMVDEEHAVVLSEEEVVVEKKVVPKERVRLATETVTTEREVTEEVRKERIETEGDVTDA